MYVYISYYKAAQNLMKNDTWKSYNPLAVGYRAVMSNVRGKGEYNNNSSNNKVYFNYYVFLYKAAYTAGFPTIIIVIIKILITMTSPVL